MTRHHFVVVVVLAVAVLLGAASSLIAQPGGAVAPAGSRWFAGVGGGYLAERSACENCDTDPPYGDGGGFLAQGGLRASERLQVGGEVFTTKRTLPSGDFRDTHLLGVFQFRPFKELGFFLKGGYGMAIVKGVLPIDGGGQTSEHTWGMAAMYGAGWIFGRSSRVSVAPVAATYVTTVGDVNTTKGTAANVVVNGWFTGVVVMLR
jgi:hypothetical protein